MKDNVMTSDYMNDAVELGRRVKEILDEKGNAFTVPAFSKRIGFSETTLYRCLNGERYFKPSELELIAEGLNLTVARIKREDTHKKHVQFLAQVKHRVNLHEALKVGLELVSSAVGCSERFELLNALGATYFHLGKINSAHNTWLDAFPFAEKIFENYKQINPLFMVVSNLILSHTKKNDFSALAQLLRKIDSMFETLAPSSDIVNHSHKGIISYSQAITALNMGDMETYEEKMNEQLEHFKKTGVPRSIAIALHNVAYMLYRVQEYKKSKEAFENVLSHLSQYEDLKESEVMYITKKDYAKVLYKLGSKTAAIELISDTLEQLADKDMQTVKCKLLLLHAMYSAEMQSAEAVLLNEKAGKDLKNIACKLLMDYCCRIGDEVGLMKYYKFGGELDSPPITEMEESL